METAARVNNQLIALMEGKDDNFAIVKTLTTTSQLVFDDVLDNDEIVEFWAEEDFSYTCSATPIAATGTSHRVPAYSMKAIVVKAGTNMAIIGTASSLKFYLSY